MDAIAILSFLANRAENLSAPALRVAIAISGMCADRRDDAIVCQLRDIAARAALSPGHARRALAELNAARFAAVQRTGRGVKISILSTQTTPPTATEQTGQNVPPHFGDRIHYVNRPTGQNPPPDSAQGARSGDPGRPDSAQGAHSERAQGAHSGSGRSPDSAQGAQSDSAQGARSEGKKSPPLSPPLNTKDKSRSRSTGAADISRTDLAAAAADSDLEGMNTRTPNGGGGYRLTPALLAHPVARFLKDRKVEESEMLNWLRTRCVGEILANIVAAHHTPPRTGDLGRVEVNAARIGFAMREHWGRWSFYEVCAAMPRVNQARREALATVATLETVSIAEEIIQEKIGAGERVRSFGGLLATIIESGEAAAVLLARTHAAHVAAAKKLAALERKQAAELARQAQEAPRTLGPSESESAELRERLARFDDAQLAQLWAAMLATITDPGAKRNLSRPHFTDQPGELRGKILSGNVARRELSRYLASLESES